MPKAKKTTRAPKQTAPDESDDSLTMGVDDTAPEMAEVLAELGADSGSLILYKRREEKWYRIRKYTPSEFSIDAIPELYGGGDYLVKVFDATGIFTGKSYPLLFDPRLKGRLDESSITTTPTIGAGNDAMLALMKQQADDNKTLLATLLSTMTAMLTASKSGEDALLDKLAKLKTVFGSDHSNQLPVTAIIEMFKAGLDVGKEANAPEGLSSGPLAERLMLTLGERLLKQMAAGKPATAISAAAPTPQPAAATPPVVAAAPSPAPAANGGPLKTAEEALAHFVPTLIEKARLNKNPEVYADLLLEEIGPEQEAETLAWLQQPTLLDELALAYPAINEPTVRAWFVELQQLLVAALTAPLEPATADAASGPSQS